MQWIISATDQVLPAAISRMEETLGSIAWLDPIEAKLVWLRASGQRLNPGGKIARVAHVADISYAVNRRLRTKCCLFDVPKQKRSR
jgi:hypothetical protein